MSLTSTTFVNPIGQSVSLTLTSPPARQTDCDGQGATGLYCGSGTCYTAPLAISNFDYIGCCSLTLEACAARTTCIPYTTSGSTDCDMDFGGCVACTNPSAPNCVSWLNPFMGQYAVYCDSPAVDPVAGTGTTIVIQTSYTNTFAPGNLAAPVSATIETVSPATVRSSSLVLPAGSTAYFTAASTIQPPRGTGLTSPPSSSAASPISAGSIAGIAIGSAAVIGVLALLCFLLLRRRANRSYKDPPGYNNHYATDHGRRQMYQHDSDAKVAQEKTESGPYETDATPATVSSQWASGAADGHNHHQAYSNGIVPRAEDVSAPVSPAMLSEADSLSRHPSSSRMHSYAVSAPATPALRQQSYPGYQAYRPSISNEQSDIRAGSEDASSASVPIGDGTSTANNTTRPFTGASFAVGTGNLPYLSAEDAMAGRYDKDLTPAPLAVSKRGGDGEV